ncbi:MAG: Rnase Y domain-containing protein, partial [Paramuribaculum sp.]|nr:Rnase Y domain-containing protein [Paramuribaculum sp.]
MTYTILWAIALIIAVAASIWGTLIVQKNNANSRSQEILREARNEAEVIKKNKLLEAREEELRIKGEAERNAQQRMSKVQSMESKLKQRENQLNQQQSENQRNKSENEQTKARLEEQS